MPLSKETLCLQRQPTLDSFDIFDVWTMKPCQLMLMEHLLKIMDNTGFELKLVTYSKYHFDFQKNIPKLLFQEMSQSHGVVAGKPGSCLVYSTWMSNTPGCDSW